jgi:hypothetical protein
MPSASANSQKAPTAQNKYWNQEPTRSPNTSPSILMKLMLLGRSEARFAGVGLLLVRSTTPEGGIYSGAFAHPTVYRSRVGAQGFGNIGHLTKPGDLLIECIEHSLELHLRHLGKHPDVLDVAD